MAKQMTIEEGVTARMALALWAWAMVDAARQGYATEYPETHYVGLAMYMGRLMDAWIDAETI